MSDAAEDRPWWATDDPAGHDREDANAHGEHVRPSWMDAVEALDGVVRAAAKGAKGAADRLDDVREGLQGQVDGVPTGGRGAGGSGGSGGSDGPGGHRHGAIDAYCHVCPVCSLLRAIEDVKPDVLVHLAEAARHLTMAAKAVVDSQAERAGGDKGFESIPIDD